MSSLTVTIIQTNLHWENKKANLDMLQRKIESIKEKTEVVILPEMFNTGFSMKPEVFAEKMDGETVQWMRKIAVEKKIILTGSVMIDPSTNAQGDTSTNAQGDTSTAAQGDPSANAHGDKKYVNRLIWMLPNGEYGVYDKRHLFAYANENDHYAAGNKKLIASVKGWKINLQVCYDLRFPVWTRQSPGNDENKYDLLINVANWPDKRHLAWKTLLRARAIENQCFVIGVNRVGSDGNQILYNGGSAIIDPLGEVIYHKNIFEDVFTCTLHKEKVTEIRNQYPFWRDADSFLINE